jgi:hypothetical protein
LSFRPFSSCLWWHTNPALARFRLETEDGPEHSGRGRRSDLHTTHAWFRGALHSARYVSRHSRGSRPRRSCSSCGQMSPSALPAPSSSRRNRGLSPIPLRGEALFKVIHPVAGVRPAGPPLRRTLDLKWLRQTRVAESDHRDRETYRHLAHTLDCALGREDLHPRGRSRGGLGQEWKCQQDERLTAASAPPYSCWLVSNISTLKEPCHTPSWGFVTK